VRGLLITFEGGEGTGKTTQIQRLGAHLAARGREVVTTREPGGTPLAERVREILLDPAQSPDALTELFLLEAARHDHVERLVRPALARGAVVLCDRFTDSSLVYQGLAGGLPLELVERLNAVATGGLEPDLTVLLDLPADAALARATARPAPPSRLDGAPEAFHRRVVQGFRELARRHPERIRLVAADGDPGTVFRRVLEAVEEVLG